MYALLNKDQEDLRSVADAIAAEIGVGNPSDLDDRDRAAGWAALAKAGLLELRARDSGSPVASGVEVMVVCQALGAHLVPQPYLPGAVLATELLESAGVEQSVIDSASAGEVGLVLTPDLTALAPAAEASDAVIWGGPNVRAALAVDGSELILLRLDKSPDADRSIALTQSLWDVPGHSADRLGRLDAADLTRWQALALTGLAADTVGVMRAALQGAVTYSQDRIAYGQPTGSFQAIQHIAADTLVSAEAAYGATCYAAWAVDELEPSEALQAARTAKAYCGMVARTATENVMQMYGGVGQTWEHIAHFYTRRALFNTQLLGGSDTHLRAISSSRLERI